MWMCDPSVGISQSMLVGVGIWVAFAYLWTFAPMFGARRGDAIVCFGAGGAGGIVGARVAWWVSQGVENKRGFGGVGEWQDMLNPMVPGYSSLGFLAGSGLVVLAIMMLSRPDISSRGRLLDVVVPAGLSGLVFARIGCVFNGCDFGKVSETGLFSIRYAQGSLAWQHHYVEGLIGGDALWSLPTQGFAFYSAGATFVVIVVITLWGAMRSGNRRAAGAVALHGVFLFCGVQFVVEFLREPLITGNLHASLNLNQMALLGVCLFFGVIRLKSATNSFDMQREV